MPEGPSIVIAREEIQPLVGQKIKSVTGSTKFDDPTTMKTLVGEKFLSIQTWGKHLILNFESVSIRVHFLMFGSYRINDPKTHLKPRLELKFAKNRLDFYTCSIKRLEKSPDETYDWSADLMSNTWSPARALKKVKTLPDRSRACDILMNQDIFSGLGNIMKNEILYRMKTQPESENKSIPVPLWKKIIREARTYACQFYEWKKAFVLKKHWEVMRKKTCPKGHAVTKKMTGIGKRQSHFCKICQKLYHSTKPL